MAAFSRPAWSAVTGQKATTGPVKGIAQLVREATDGGRLLVDTLVAIATGPDSSDRDKVSASSILLDRGFGRAVETTLSLSVDAGSSEALSQLADAELERRPRPWPRRPCVPSSFSRPVHCRRAWIPCRMPRQKLLRHPSALRSLSQIRTPLRQPTP